MLHRKNTVSRKYRSKSLKNNVYTLVSGVFFFFFSMGF